MKHSWDKYKIIDVFNLEKGGLQSSKNKPGEFTFITASEETKTHNEYHYDTEALCFAFAASGSLGRTHYYKGKFIASDLVYVLTPKKEFINKVNLRYCYYYLNNFRDEIVRLTKSGTSKVSINRGAFSKVEIPLPSLSDQNRMVLLNDIIKTKLDQIKELRAEQTKDINNLLFSKYTEIIKDAQWLPMKEVAPIIRREVKLNDEQQYPELGIRCFGKGTFHKPALTGAEVGTKKIFQIKEGDLVFSNVFAWEGGIAVAQNEDNDRYGSHRFISCVVNNEKALADFLFFHFLSPKGLEDINACSPGGAGRNKTLGLDKLMKINVPVPTLALQQEFVTLLKKINSIKKYHIQTNQDLSELMPSLLDKAFKGELTFAEEAENLLIAAEPESKYHAVVKSNIPENKKSFAKQVLGGKIVSLFREDKYFTHIKFQKLQYIAEHIIEEDLNWNYYRQSAGPYDNKFMHSVVSNLSRNKWFEERNYKFYSLEKATDIDNYYQTYFGNKSDKLNKLFGLLKNASEKFCEAVATIYAVWNNHIIQNQQFNKEKIKTDFFAWSNRKENLFTDDEFEKALLWMQKNSIEPTGFGQLIKERK